MPLAPILFAPILFAQRLLLALCAAFLLVCACGVAWAEEPTFRIEFKDGVTTPLRPEVPAKTRFRLELVNLGNTPAEFESLELRKEKAIAPQSQTVMVIRSLDPGEYRFFDDFHPGGAPAVLIAK